uniref:Uncharacterized protein n=1 Tax=Avena sativa TaxID=4498 RepID=A0ACD5ZIT3_AVESA
MRCSAVLFFFFFLLFLVLPRRCPAADAGTLAPVPAPAPGRSIIPDPLLACLEEVLPCTAYLKSSKRPAPTCCTALNRAAGTEMPCLCQLLADPGMLVDFNVTKEQALKLPTRCGLPVGCHSGATGISEPVVEAPPPAPAVRPARRGADPSSGGWSRTSTVGRAIATVVLCSGLVSVVVLS